MKIKYNKILDTKAINNIKALGIDIFSFFKK